MSTIETIQDGDGVGRSVRQTCLQYQGVGSRSPVIFIGDQ